MNTRYGIREMRATTAWQDKKCYCCSSRFKAGDSLVLLIPSIDLKRKYKKLSKNVVMHEDEYNELYNKYGDDIMEFLGNYAKPRVKERLTKEQEERLAAFRKACNKMGLLVETESIKTDGICKRRKGGTSLTFIYNVYTMRASVTHRGKRGVFDPLFEQELLSTLRIEMNQFLGKHTIEKDRFTVQKAVEQAIEEVNSIF